MGGFKTTPGTFTPGTLPAAWTLAGAPARVMAAATAAGVATTASTSVTPFGYTTGAQADAIPVAINNLEADVATIRNNVAQIITDLRTEGLQR